MRMLGERVAIKLDETTNKTSGGIHLPNDTKVSTGVVKYVPAGSPLNEGDRVQFAPALNTPGNIHNLGGESLLVITVKDLIAVL